MIPPAWGLIVLQEIHELRLKQERPGIRASCQPGRKSPVISPGHGENRICIYKFIRFTLINSKEGPEKIYFRPSVTPS